MTDNRLAESWTWYSLVCLIVIWRFVSRSLLLGGWRHLQLEDYLMVLTFGFYTNLIVWVNVQTKYPETNILPDTGLAGLSQADINFRIYGSKVTFVIEQSMLMVQWGCKACIIIMYYKLTMNLKSQRLVKLLMGYIFLGWLVVEICFYAVWCRPFLNYFAVKVDNSLQCETSGHHLIMSYVFNLSSDVLMLFIPLPLLIRSQLPWKKKVALCAIFGLGIFVIIAATLNRYYCFAHPDSILWIFWYVREASTCMIVANVPNCYTLLKHMLNLRNFDSVGTRGTFSFSGSFSKGTFSRKSQSIDRTKVELSKVSNSRSTRTEEQASESMEEINQKDQPLEIWQQREFAVENCKAQSDDELILPKGLVYGDQSGQMKSTVVGGDYQQPTETDSAV